MGGYAIQSVEADILGDILLDSSGEAKGAYTYTAGTTEQTIFTLTTTARKTIQSAFLDLSAMTQKGTIRAYYKIDGSNYRSVGSWPFDPAIDTVGFVENFNLGITDDFKMTYQASVTEGVSRVINFSAVYDIRE
jgi:hypothetical protein